MNLMTGLLKPTQGASVFSDIARRARSDLSKARLRKKVLYFLAIQLKARHCLLQGKPSYT
jgi:hypothetical protein